MSSFEDIAIQDVSLEPEETPTESESVPIQTDEIASSSVKLIRLEDAIEVIYCPTCGFPPEYCSYGPNFDACLPWILENAVDVLGKNLKTLPI